MAAEPGSLRQSRTTGNSLAGLGRGSAAVNRDAKAQHILGLSRTQLDYARIETSTSKRASILSSAASSDRGSRRSLLLLEREKSVESSHRQLIFEQRSVDSILLGFDEDSDVSALSRSTSLSEYPSTLTLKSSCEADAKSLPASQHGPHLPGVNFGFRTDLPAGSDALEREMECGQRRFFRSSKMKSIGEYRDFDSDALDIRSRPMFAADSSRSSFGICPKVKSHFATKISVQPLYTRPTTPSTTFFSEKPSPNHDRPRATLRKKRPAEVKVVETRVIETTITKSTLATPYAKIHVRKPKAGTKDWFDDLDGVSSEGEDFETGIRQVREIGFVEELGQTPAVASLSQVHTRKSSRGRKAMQVTINEEPELLVRPFSPIYGSTSPRNRSRKSSMKSLNDPVTTHDPLVSADLSQDSVLNLSLSDDELETGNVSQSPEDIQVTAAAHKIRKSIAEGMNEDSDVEVGLAHAVTTASRLSNKRPAPIRIMSNKESSVLAPSPITASPWRLAPKDGSWNSASNASDGSDVKETDEEILLRSFPATPTDANRPRSSVSLSDEGRIMGMRLMKVTRQEENLIAAMRMKRAAMKRAERAAAHGTMSRTHDDVVTVPARRSSLVETPRSSVDTNRPVTAFVPDSHGRGSSEIPLLVEFQETSQLRDFSETYSRRKSSVTSYASYGPFPRLQSSFVSTSSGDSRRRDSNLIVLDNLNSELPRRIFPSQLYMESPFATWEKQETSSVH